MTRARVDPLDAAAARLVAEGETLEPRLTPFIPHRPHPRQAVFLSPPVTLIREVFFGGAAGGGKSDALLMAALQYVDVPGYASLLVRRTYRQLAQEGALMERSHEWLAGKARWSEQDHRWTFPSGATLTFGHMEHSQSHRDYQGAEFHFIGVDEVTDFPDAQYRFLFSRLRRTTDIDVPIRMRSSSNPIGPGKEWVQRRFVAEGAREQGRLFIPSRLEDNPSLDAAAYERSLRELGSVAYQQLRWGDWNVKPEGVMFKRAWFPVIGEHELPAGLRRARYWDLAATETPKGANARRMGDPDYTVGLLLGRDGAGTYYVEDVTRGRWSSAKVEAVIARVAEDEDGRGVPVRMEQEPGASGKALISHYRRNVLDGFDFRGVPSTGSKETRAQIVAARAEMGEVVLVEGPWVEAFLDEISEFPEGTHDDQVDALSGAFAALAGRRTSAVAPTGSTGRSYWRE